MKYVYLIGLILVTNSGFSQGKIGSAELYEKQDTNCYITQFAPSKAVDSANTLFITPKERADLCIDPKDRVVTTIQLPSVKIDSRMKNNRFRVFVSYARTKGICENNIFSGINVYQAGPIILNEIIVEDWDIVGTGNFIEFEKDGDDLGYLCYGVKRVLP